MEIEQLEPLVPRAPEPTIPEDGSVQDPSQGAPDGETFSDQPEDSFEEIPGKPLPYYHGDTFDTSKFMPRQTPRLLPLMQSLDQEKQLSAYKSFASAAVDTVAPEDLYGEQVWKNMLERDAENETPGQSMAQFKADWNQLSGPERVAEVFKTSLRDDAQSLVDFARGYVQQRDGGQENGN